MEDLIYQEDGNYFIKGEDDRKEGRSELTKWQFDAIRNLQSGAVSSASGNLSEADIIRLHQESDPASSLYKRPEHVNGGESGLASGESESHSLYNEPTQSELEQAAKGQPEPQGSTVITTEQATIPPVIEETPLKEDIDHTVIQEDIDNNAPDLADAGVGVGDPIVIPADAQVDPEIVKEDEPAKVESKAKAKK